MFGNIFETYYFWKYGHHSLKCWKCCVPSFLVFQVYTFRFSTLGFRKLNLWNFEISNFELFEIWNFELLKFWTVNILKTWKVKAEDRKMMKIRPRISWTAWIWISYRSKIMTWKFGKSYKLFCFQVREAPVSLNIPTPTPASDHGIGKGPEERNNNHCTKAPRPWPWSWAPRP